ncbi:MAG: hypothetical protein WDO15_01760 [Bacteroidota bacterium]
MTRLGIAYANFIAFGSHLMIFFVRKLSLHDNAGAAALKPNSASSTTGLLVRIASKKFVK